MHSMKAALIGTASLATIAVVNASEDVTITSEDRHVHTLMWGACESGDSETIYAQPMRPFDAEVNSVIDCDPDFTINGYASQQSQVEPMQFTATGSQTLSGLESENESHAVHAWCRSQYEVTFEVHTLMTFNITGDVNASGPDLFVPTFSEVKLTESNRERNPVFHFSAVADSGPQNNNFSLSGTLLPGTYTILGLAWVFTDTYLGSFTFEDHSDFDFSLTLALAGDLNGDGVVDIVDLLELLAAWGPCEVTDDCPADIDDSGEVDTTDLLTLLGQWG